MTELGMDTDHPYTEAHLIRSQQEPITLMGSWSQAVDWPSQN